MREVTTGTITASYGTAVHGFIVGGGYGRNDVPTSAANSCAAALVQAFGLPVEKRGNSSGKDGGAWHNMKGRWESWFGIGWWPPNSNSHKFDMSGSSPFSCWHAMFLARESAYPLLQANVPRVRIYVPAAYNRTGYVTVHSCNFDSLDLAVAWLRIYGRRYCPKLRRIQ